MKKINIVWIYAILSIVVFWSGFFLFNWVSPYASMIAYVISLFMLMLFFKHIIKKQEKEKDEN